MIFGNSGGVSEAVLRYASEVISGKTLPNPDFPAVRGDAGIRVTTMNVGDTELKLAVVHGLKNARELAQRVRRGECQLDLIEVMACPGGCVGGAGQPVNRDTNTRKLRARGLYDIDKNLDLHKSQENHHVTECYQKHLGEVGGHSAHELLHTKYQNRRRITDQDLLFGAGADKLKVKVCVGTNCFLKGSQSVLHGILKSAEGKGIEDKVEVCASFCFEQCEHGPIAQVGDTQLKGCTVEKLRAAIERNL